MLILTTWLAIMGAGGLCHPRRPRAAGALFVVAGVFIFAAWAAGAIGNTPPITAATSLVLGFAQLWRFRDSTARAAHVAEWTRRA